MTQSFNCIRSALLPLSLFISPLSPFLIPQASSRPCPWEEANAEIRARAGDVQNLYPIVPRQETHRTAFRCSTWADRGCNVELCVMRWCAREGGTQQKTKYLWGDLLNPLKHCDNLWETTPQSSGPTQHAVCVSLHYRHICSGKTLWILTGSNTGGPSFTAVTSFPAERGRWRMEDRGVTGWGRQVCGRMLAL